MWWAQGATASLVGLISYDKSILYVGGKSDYIFQFSTTPKLLQ